MTGAASLVFAVGMVAGLMLLRRGWVRTYALLLSITVFFTGLIVLGIMPVWMLPQNQDLAVALLVTPIPLGAGVICGGITAWLLRRVGS